MDTTIETVHDVAVLPDAGRALLWDWIFLAVGIPFGLILLVVVPPGMAVDSPVHLVRIDQIARGGLVSPINSRHLAIATPDGCLSAQVTVMELQTFIKPVLSRQWHGTRCGRPRPNDISNAALNSPIPYLPQVAGYAVGRALGGLLAGIWLAKLAGLAAYLAVCWLAIRVTPWGKPFLFVVALFPTSMTLAVSLSADPVPLSLGLLAIALVLRLREPGGSSRGLLWGLAVTLVALALAKDLYAVAALLVLLVPADRFETGKGRRWYRAGVLGAAAAGILGWSLGVVQRVNLGVTGSFKQRAWIRAHPLGFAHIAARSIGGTTLLVRHTLPGMIATSPARIRAYDPAEFMAALAHLQRSPVFQVAGYPAPPAWITLVGLAAMLAAIASGGSASRRSTGHDRLLAWVVPAIVMAVVMALVLYGEAISVTAGLWNSPNITYIEGRFFLPVVPLLVLLPWSTVSWQPDALLARRLAWVVPVAALVMAVWTLAGIAQLY